MIIMISSEGDSLQSHPSLRFGRAPYFIAHNTDDDTSQVFSNDAVLARGGAGVAASQFLIDHKISAALSGAFGPNAARVLSAAGIKMLTFDDSYKTIQSVINGFKGNLLIEV